MALKEKFIAIFVGAIASIIFLVIFFFSYFLFLVYGISGLGSVFGMNMSNPWTINLLFIGLSGFAFFFLPPILSSIIYDRSNPSASDMDHLIVASSSSGLIVLMIILLMFSISTWVTPSQLITDRTVIVCPIAFVFWCVLSGLSGPIAIHLKRLVLNKIKKS